MATLELDDYTIAWVCALPLEAAAARAMLEKIHSPPQHITDPNAYEFGELNGHHIVIAYLPNGAYGTVSAAAVVSRMRLTFPRLQFGLMVGIGGGVPSKRNDIRSGEVLYDYGKAAQGGQFEPTGILNQPPQVLLTHMSQLEAKQITGEDIKRQTRNTRTPYIHYGLTASGDQVMKDSETRDRLARQHRILCIEMEAAGLINELSTLVIRGICDNCDSHKQKQWQGYAALTAAAYTKLLLSTIPVCRASSSLPKGNKPRHWVVSLPRNPKFVGWPRRVTITGLGGVGKTQVALEVAYRIRDRDKECSVLWVPYDTEMWLSANDTAPALEDFLPQSEQGYIMFTTRNRKLAMKLAPFNIIPIPDVHKGTAFQILGKALEHKNLPKDDTTAAALLEQLAFLPLAITQASAYILKMIISLSNYLALLQEQEEDAVDLLSEDFRDPGRYKDIQNAVIPTWLISFNQIQSQSQAAADYLSFMACINP
ncbi:nucleoside phosphorylase domain-containing protein [Aspergillus desertorum]